MTEESKSTEEAQADATVEATTETATQDTAEATAVPGTGMIAPQPDREIEATDTSQDTPMSELAKPLFDETAPSEAELGGEEGEPEEATGEPSGTEESAAASQPTDEKKPEEEASKEGPVEEASGDKPEEKKPEKPPAGYVPHAALHEQRMLRQELSQEVAELRQELADIKGKDLKPDKDAFKVLSDEEFDELAEEDPAEAVKYERQLNKHLREQEAIDAKNKASEDQYRQDQAIINQSIERMEKAVPGLYEEGSPVNQELGQFAIENGFDPDFLGAMTSPSTLILPPKAKNAVLLGDGAAGLVSMIYKLRSAIKVNDPEALRAQIKTEIEKELTETITKQLMAKFKSQTGMEFKSIGDVPGASDEIPSASGGFTTEAQYANMSQTQRDKLLGA